MSTAQCLVGSHCGYDNTCRVGPTAGQNGDPCTTDVDCEFGHTCSNDSCVTIGTPPPSCTKVSVFRLYYVGNAELADSLAPPAGSTYYPNSNATWLGCNAPGANLIPLYLWFNNSVGRGDYVWSLSASQPFINGSRGYSIQNAGNPVLYVYSAKLSAQLLPLYRLEGANTDTNESYHTTQLNSSTLQIAGVSSVSYTGDVNMSGSNSTGLLGYAYAL